MKLDFKYMRKENLGYFYKICIFRPTASKRVILFFSDIAKLNSNFNLNFSLSFELSLALLSNFPTTHPATHQPV